MKHNTNVEMSLTVLDRNWLIGGFGEEILYTIHERVIDNHLATEMKYTLYSMNWNLLQYNSERNIIICESKSIYNITNYSERFKYADGSL